MNDNEYIQELREGEEAETVNLAGFQVAKAELFEIGRASCRERV